MRSNNTQHLKLLVCKSCNLKLSADRFESIKGSNGTKYRIKTCRKCRAKNKTEVKLRKKRAKQRNSDLKRLNDWKDKNRGTIESFIYSNLYRWRKRSIKKCNVMSNLTFEYLISLWKQQNGNCYYTNAKLDPLEPQLNSRKQLSKSLRKAMSPSLDRLNPDKGYIIGNVVWCGHSVNSMKGDLKEKDFIKICKKISSK